MAVETPELVIGPLLQAVQNFRIDPYEKRLPLCHYYWYMVPVLMTGWVEVSPQSTTSRLDTIAAFLS